MPRIITYECTQCGTEVVVTADGETNLRPIYCCGIEVTEVSSGDRPERIRKKTAKKPARKSVRPASVKKGAPKKGADTKKKTVKGKKTASARKTAKRRG